MLRYCVASFPSTYYFCLEVHELESYRAVTLNLLLRLLSELATLCVCLYVSTFLYTFRRVCVCVSACVARECVRTKSEQEQLNQGRLRQRKQRREKTDLISRQPISSAQRCKFKTWFLYAANVI